MESTIKEQEQQGIGHLNPNFEEVQLQIQNAMNHKSQEDAQLLISLNNNLTVYSNQIEEISNFASSYDSRNGTAGNGFKSFVTISQIVFKKISIELNNLERHVSGLFTGGSKTEELTSWNNIVKDLIIINEFLFEMRQMSPLDLFPKDPDIEKVEKMARRIANINFKSFYGHLGAFYLKGDSVKMAQSMLFCQAFYGDVFGGSAYQKAGSFLSSLGGLKYLMFPDTMADHLARSAREKQIQFCKSFYSLPENELIRMMSTLRSYHVTCNQEISIPTVKMTIHLLNGLDFEVPIPHSYIGTQPVKVRLIAPFRTKEMTCQCRCLLVCSCIKRNLPSEAVVFHLQGGGYVSQSSKSHESYLKQWCKEWNTPILSVDYSLAPEAPFPRALEEVLYAYCWMHLNYKMLGSSGRKVILGGNSAGANLAVGLIQLCAKYNLPKPELIFLGYPSLLCQMYPSPSRLICLFDPLVMFPFLLRCLNSYADPDYKSKCPRTFQEEIDSSCKRNEDPLLSPLFTPEVILAQFPPTFMFTSDMDPCLDETVDFSNRLVRSGMSDVTLHIESGLPHGFMSYNGMSLECQAAVDRISARLKDFLKLQ